MFEYLKLVPGKKKNTFQFYQDEKCIRNFVGMDFEQNFLVWKKIKKSMALKLNQVLDDQIKL